MSKKEEKIRSDMRLAGTYREEFEPTIKQLARLQTELSRAEKAWRDDGGDFVSEYTNKAGATNFQKNPYYSVVVDLRKEILTYYTALGLTPAGQKKINDQLKKEQKKSKLEALSGMF